MPDNEQSEDFLHLPTADSSADAAKRAKAALWKEIAEKRQSRLSAQAPAMPPPPPLEEPEPEVAPLHDDWADLLSLDPDAAHEPLPPMEMHAPPPVVATPVEVQTRGDVSSRSRTVIRRSAPPAPVSDAVTRVFITSPVQPASAPEPMEEAPSEPPPRRAKAKREEPRVESAPPETAPEVSPEATADSKPEVKEQKSEEKAPAAEVAARESQPSTRSAWLDKWESFGGRSLAISLAIHALIIGLGGFLVVNQGLLDSQVDFLPGGTQQGAAASQDLQHKIQQKKSPWLKKAPMRRIASMTSISEIVLPDEVPDMLDLPQSSDLLSSNKIGGGLGGAGGGFGKGMGLGSKSGMVFQPLSMFGREIKAKRLALVLDVSGSMTPYLPRVIEEVDKVARNSIIILYAGCGLDVPPPRGLEGEEIFRTSGTEFEKFWRMGGMATLEDTRKFKISAKDAIPSESIYRVLSRRPQTYFVHYLGTNFTWVALLSEQVRQADALYWFSDFQDFVNFKQVLTVKENLLRRKQKLYIQPYQHGSSFDLVKSQLVDPTGGDVIEAVFE